MGKCPPVGTFAENWVAKCPPVGTFSENWVGKCPPVDTFAENWVGKCPLCPPSSAAPVLQDSNCFQEDYVS